MTQSSGPINLSDNAWAEWLRHGRYAGDAGLEQLLQHELAEIRDRVLDAAVLQPAMTLVDIGAGDGLVAFGAIERIGPSMSVVLTDVSATVLEMAENRAKELKIDGQCRFVHGTAERLTGIADQQADAATSRAVLAYVSDKLAAFGELYRILRPGGRLSIAEPIFQDAAYEVVAMGAVLRTTPPSETDVLQLLFRWRSAQLPSTEEAVRGSPVTNFNERDLVRLARHAGFVDIHLELHLDVRPSVITTWNQFLDVARYPWAPTLREILRDQFSEHERALLEMMLRPQIEAGQSLSTDAIAYLSARRPQSG
ncbi:MAG: methyltransferase domain-containing protein [Gemmatimonadota bacterium]|nr:methyltransferase domain-containing protein [Gemmatimonadota bacterium]